MRLMATIGVFFFLSQAQSDALVGLNRDGVLRGLINNSRYSGDSDATQLNKAFSVKSEVAGRNPGSCPLDNECPNSTEKKTLLPFNCQVLNYRRGPATTCSFEINLATTNVKLPIYIELGPHFAQNFVQKTFEPTSRQFTIEKLSAVRAVLTIHRIDFVPSK